MQKKTKLITMSNAINEALHFSMKKDKNLLCFGLGTTDPKGIFSTTINLEKKFGKDRVFDVPASENALTGIIQQWSSTAREQIEGGRERGGEIRGREREREM